MDSRKDAALHELARNQYERQQDPQPASTRRNLLRTAIGGGAAALLFGSATGSASAQASGTLPVSTDPPLLKIRADRMVLTPRTSDVSSPSDGTIWYRSDI